MIRGHSEATVTDLPGIYSLSPYTSEEVVTRDFLLWGHADAIINIRFGSSSVMQGAAEVMAYGTAVKFK